jgi:hypothetical protein
LRGRLDTLEVIKHTSECPPCPIEKASDGAALGRGAHGRLRAAPLLAPLAREELPEGGRGRGDGGRAVEDVGAAEEEAALVATLGWRDVCPDIGGAGHGFIEGMVPDIGGAGHGFIEGMAAEGV